jgi:hypothetical protein
MAYYQNHDRRNYFTEFGAGRGFPTSSVWISKDITDSKETSLSLMLTRPGVGCELFGRRWKGPPPEHATRTLYELLGIEVRNTTWVRLST